MTPKDFFSLSIFFQEIQTLEERKKCLSSFSSMERNKFLDEEPTTITSEMVVWHDYGFLVFVLRSRSNNDYDWYGYLIRGEEPRANIPSMHDIWVVVWLPLTFMPICYGINHRRSANKYLVDQNIYWLCIVYGWLYCHRILMPIRTYNLID